MFSLRKLLRPLVVQVPQPTPADVFTFAQLDSHAGDIAAVWVSQGGDKAMAAYKQIVEANSVSIIERKRLFNRAATLVASHVGQP